MFRGAAKTKRVLHMIGPSAKENRNINVEGAVNEVVRTKQTKIGEIAMCRASLCFF